MRERRQKKIRVKDRDGEIKAQMSESKIEVRQLSD